jgi:hypothetical protein
MVKWVLMPLAVAQDLPSIDTFHLFLSTSEGNFMYFVFFLSCAICLFWVLCCVHGSATVFLMCRALLVINWLLRMNYSHHCFMNACSLVCMLHLLFVLCVR